MTKSEIEFRIFTLNCWAIPLISKHRKHRIQAIGDFLLTCNYDVVCLQEVWSDNDYTSLKNKVSCNLPYAHYFYSGIMGSGICIFSRHPIEEAFFHQWTLNGYIHKIHHGDWFGGKGVALCKLNVNGFKVNVYSAHLHAEYSREFDEYEAHRVLQAYDTAQFVLLTIGNTDLVVLAGDLNTEPGDLACRIICGVPGLTDAFTEAGDISQDMVATNECLRNSYTPSSLIKKKALGKRIDYIMYHAGSNIQVDLKKYSVPLSNSVPNKPFSYSDHEAVACTLSVKKADTSKEKIDLEFKKSVLEECISVCAKGLKGLRTNKMVFLFFAFVLLVILAIVLILPPLFDSPITYFVIKLFITIIMLYFVFMATLWNRMEQNGLLAAKLAMEVSLNKLDNKVL